MSQAANYEVDPQEFFAVLGDHAEYPVSGIRLAEEAREKQADPKVVEFFEQAPITFADEGQVVEHAMKVDEAPVGYKLDLSSRQEDIKNPPATNETLEINDIVHQSKSQ